MSEFKKLGLSAQLADVLQNMGFENPTPVQKEAIPLLLQNDPTDFIGMAQTGTGKTAAFGLPLIELIDVEEKATQALVMAPTRELGQQIGQQLKDFSKAVPKMNIEVVYGGAAITNQMKALKKTTQIVVATPGRLLDLIKRKAIKLGNVRFVVLDEADEMLNMGFKEDIDQILSHTLDIRSTWLFSATMPSEIRKIINKYMVQPLEVKIQSEVKSNKDITHQYVVTKTANKVPALRRFLDIQPDMRGIMFCRTKRETQEIADALGSMGYGTEALHGDLSQAQRDAVMKRFKSRSMQLLVATDVAARGIDVNDLTHVLHHKLPDQLESYTHRSGRTGRAGNKGFSIAFVNPREVRRVDELGRKINVDFQKVEVPSIQQVKSVRISKWANLIVNTEVDEQADEILSGIKEKFQGLSKDDLLKRLITTQLDHLIAQNGEEDDLNEIQGKKKEGKDRKFLRYFINVGTMDGVTKSDLVHFLSDVSGIDRKAFGSIELQKTNAFFELEKGKQSGLLQKFENIDIEGRAIRVNLDEDANRKKSSTDKQGKKKSNSRNNRYGGNHQGNGKKKVSRRDNRDRRRRR
ncbi:DEAD/DEAH box helicase [Reichenbachiella versicolor]|uniref:DEAD/DEAH box helicase n=1 Tax=Reichenbachiella versicolor TaxID=1821036 RepID=UPI000D6E13F6|nr:DEAD/DEAH box helicase [Reichenbachiella versicolor]